MSAAAETRRPAPSAAEYLTRRADKLARLKLLQDEIWRIRRTRDAATIAWAHERAAFDAAEREAQREADGLLAELSADPSSGVRA